jgi:hypothetical protein
MSHHPDLEEEEFPEPEDSDVGEADDMDENGANEEEEEQQELVVIDDEFISGLVTDVEKGNPVKLAQAIDVILGALELRDNVIFDEGHTLNPLSTLLVPLVAKVNEIYEGSLGKNANKRKVTEKMLTDLVQVYDSFDKFKDKLDLIKSYLETVYITRNFVGKDDISSALSKVSMVASRKATEVLNEYYARFAEDEKYVAMIYKLRYIAFTNSVTKMHDEAIDASLDSLVDFYLEKPEKSKSYVKGLIKSFSDRLAKSMAKLDKDITTWNTIGMVEFVTAYTIKSKTNCFLVPLVTDFMVLLRNISIMSRLPFQLRVAKCLARLGDEFGKVVPLLSWAVDAVAVICNFKCKGSARFNWNADLEVPQVASYEFAEEAIDRLHRIIMQQLTAQCENIAFPEYAESARRKLESITATGKNERLRLKPKSIIKTIAEQQQALVNIKKGLTWATRNEQISAWKPAVANTMTPIKESEERAKAVEALVQATKAKAISEGKEVVDDTGDTLKAVTADNFMD